MRTKASSRRQRAYSDLFAPQQRLAVLQHHQSVSAKQRTSWQSPPHSLSPFASIAIIAAGLQIYYATHPAHSRVGSEFTEIHGGPAIVVCTIFDSVRYKLSVWIEYYKGTQVNRYDGSVLLRSWENIKCTHLAGQVLVLPFYTVLVYELTI
jgi:hypothetical protein